LKIHKNPVSKIENAFPKIGNPFAKFLEIHLQNWKSISKNWKSISKIGNPFAKFLEIHF
jgi:hypothetical protein